MLTLVLNCLLAVALMYCAEVLLVSILFAVYNADVIHARETR